jgi:hypothetical protein
MEQAHTVSRFALFDPAHQRRLRREDADAGDHDMFRLIATMRRGSATGIDAAWAHYATIEAARLGSATLLHDDRVLRAMIVRDETPPAFVEWAER